MVIFIFGTENSVLRFYLKQADMWTYLTIAHGLSFGLSEMSSGSENSPAFLYTVVWLPPYNKFYVIQFQVAFQDTSIECVKWQWFSKALQSPAVYICHSSIIVFLVSATWGFQDHTHSAVVYDLALYTMTHFGIFLQYYVLYMLKDLNSLQSCVEKRLFWNDY